MRENLKEIQQAYEAISGKSCEKNDTSAVFDTEYARKYHLEHLDSKEIQSFVTYLENEGSTVANASIMKEALKNYLSSKQTTVVDTKKATAVLSTQQATGALRQET